MSLATSMPRLLTGLLGMVQTRFALAAVELEEGLLRFACLLVAALGALMLMLIGTVFGSALVVVAYWDSHRVAALAGVSVFYLLAAGILFGLVLRSVNRGPGFMTASLASLQEDRQQLQVWR